MSESKDVDGASEHSWGERCTAVDVGDDDEDSTLVFCKIGTISGNVGDDNNDGSADNNGNECVGDDDSSVKADSLSAGDGDAAVEGVAGS
jgi:hypothetical protein